jgi:hypothetical protein
MFVNFGIKNLFLFHVTQLAFFFCSLVVNFSFYLQCPTTLLHGHL